MKQSSNVFAPLYDFFSKNDPRKLTKEDLPPLNDYEYMLTKVLCYSELYGRVSQRGKSKSKIKNTVTLNDEFRSCHPESQDFEKVPVLSIEGRNSTNPPNINYNFQMPYDEAEKYFSNLGIIDAPAFYEDLNKYAGQAFTISYITKSETLLGVKNFLSAQLGTGEVDPKLLAEKIQEYAVKNGDDALHPWHLQTVVRTNLQTAFAKGRYKEQLDGDDPYWQYFATVDGRETPLCHSLDNKVFRKDDPFWKQNYPPNHFNCRSTVVTLDEDTLEEEGLKVENDGSKYLEQMQKKYPDKTFDAGKGFNLAPDRGLSKWLNKKCKEHGIENVEDKVPEFKHYREAETYFSNIYKDTKFDLKGIDTKILNEYSQSYGMLQKEFKVNNLTYFGTLTKGQTPATFPKVRFEKGNPALAVEYKVKGDNTSYKALCLKKMNHKNYDDVVQKHQKEIEQNWVVGDKKTALHTLYHEYGHLVDFEYNVSSNKKVIDIYRKETTLISKYGSDDIYEFIAEAFADVHISDNPTNTSIKVFDVIKEIVGGK